MYQHSADRIEDELENLRHLEQLCDKYEQLIKKSLGFQINEHISVERRGDDVWCVSVGGGAVLNKNLDVMYEPSASNRTEEFIAATRFTLDDALKIAYDFAKGDIHGT